jgi:hypothetical protein
MRAGHVYPGNATAFIEALHCEIKKCDRCRRASFGKQKNPSVTI